jgi:hypothetical protein
MWFERISEKKTYFLYSINLWVFITEAQYVYWAVRTEYLNVIQFPFCVKSVSLVTCMFVKHIKPSCLVRRLKLALRLVKCTPIHWKTVKNNIKNTKIKYIIITAVRNQTRHENFPPEPVCSMRRLFALGYSTELSFVKLKLLTMSILPTEVTGM